MAMAAIPSRRLCKCPSRAAAAAFLSVAVYTAVRCCSTAFVHPEQQHFARRFRATAAQRVGTVARRSMRSVTVTIGNDCNLVVSGASLAAAEAGFLKNPRETVLANFDRVETLPEGGGFYCYIGSPPGNKPPSFIPDVSIRLKCELDTDTPGRVNVNVLETCSRSMDSKSGEAIYKPINTMTMTTKTTYRWKEEPGGLCVASACTSTATLNIPKLFPVPDGVFRAGLEAFVKRVNARQLQKAMKSIEGFFASTAVV